MLTICSTLLEASVRKGSGSCMSFLDQTKLRSFSTQQKPSKVKKQKTKNKTISPARGKMHQKLCGVKKNEPSPLKRQHQLEEMLHARQMLKQALKLGLGQRQPLASWN